MAENCSKVAYVEVLKTLLKHVAKTSETPYGCDRGTASFSSSMRFSSFFLRKGTYFPNHIGFVFRLLLIILNQSSLSHIPFNKLTVRGKFTTEVFGPMFLATPEEVILLSDVICKILEKHAGNLDILVYTVGTAV
jgi:hypothetical protein